MGTAAILGSWDTKQTEMRYMRDRLTAAGLDVVYIDVSVFPDQSFDERYGYSSAVLHERGADRWRAAEGGGRGALIDCMSTVTAEFVRELHDEKKIDGIIGAGGLQNTTLAVAAMRQLPIGFPKVIATTVASGNRTFKEVLKNQDIVVVPSVTDIAGLNYFTRATLTEACSCLAGVMTSPNPAASHEQPRVALTMMGVTDRAASAALATLQKAGCETVGFHATGAGGAALEELVAAGWFDAVLDLTLHEITSEYFAGGYSYGATDRLNSAIAADLPMILAPGGLDFVDYYTAEFPRPLEDRKYVLHNGSLAHIKITATEASAVGSIVGRRILAARSPVTMLVPTQGMRAEAGPGEALHDPTVDSALIGAIREAAGPQLQMRSIDGSLNSAEFGQRAAEDLLALMRARGLAVGATEERRATR